MYACVTHMPVWLLALLCGVCCSLPPSLPPFSPPFQPTEFHADLSDALTAVETETGDGVAAYGCDQRGTGVVVIAAVAVNDM